MLLVLSHAEQEWLLLGWTTDTIRDLYLWIIVYIAVGKQLFLYLCKQGCTALCTGRKQRFRSWQIANKDISASKSDKAGWFSTGLFRSTSWSIYWPSFSTGTNYKTIETVRTKLSLRPNWLRVDDKLRTWWTKTNFLEYLWCTIDTDC